MLAFSALDLWRDHSTKEPLHIYTLTDLNNQVVCSKVKTLRTYEKQPFLHCQPLAKFNPYALKSLSKYSFVQSTDTQLACSSDLNNSRAVI